MDPLPPRQPVSASIPILLVFGGPCVIADGRRVIPPQSGQRLLAMLALLGGAVDRHHVAAQLWPGVDRRRADGNLRTALWRLHGVNLDVVECDGLELRLRDEVAVDAQLLLAWAARIINGSSRFEDIRLPPNIQDGLCVLPGWCDEWLLAARESLRQTALHALEQLSQRLHQVGRFAEAVEAAVIAVGADPLRDSAQNALVAAHLAEGNLIEAHRARDTYRRIVHRELGVQMPMLTVPAASWGGVGCVRP